MRALLIAAAAAIVLSSPAHAADLRESPFTACAAKKTHNEQAACTKQVMLCSRPIVKKMANPGSTAINSAVRACGGGEIRDL
jgi:hypothetical protein